MLSYIHTPKMRKERRKEGGEIEKIIKSLKEKLILIVEYYSTCVEFLC